MATVNTYTVRSPETEKQLFGPRATKGGRDCIRSRSIPMTAKETVEKMMAAIPGMRVEEDRQQQRGGGVNIRYTIYQTLPQPIESKHEAHGTLYYKTTELVHVVTE